MRALQQPWQIRISPAVLIGGAVFMLALPSAVLAFSANFAPRNDLLSDDARNTGYTPALVDSRLARQISVSSLPAGQVFRFTPAGISNHAERSVTVAVRVDAATARAVNVRTAMGTPGSGATLSPLRIAPTAYSLGIARGSQGFALPADIKRIEVPDLTAFTPSSGPKDQPSRFNPRLSLDAREKTGRSPRTFEANGEQTVDLGGSYRLGKNLDVTAGLRYQRERDRLVPLTDGRQDSQAVYVGTQFRF